MSGSNFCYLTCIQVSQEAGKVVWSHLFQNFPVCCDPHKVFRVVNEAEVDLFIHLFEIPLLFLWSRGCWQFDVWSFCLFWIQLYIWKFSGMVRYIIILKFSISQFLKGHQYWGLSPLLIHRHQHWQERSYSDCSISWVLLSSSAVYIRPTFLPRYYPPQTSSICPIRPFPESQKQSSSWDCSPTHIAPTPSHPGHQWTCHPVQGTSGCGMLVCVVLTPFRLSQISFFSLQQPQMPPSVPTDCPRCGGLPPASAPPLQVQASPTRSPRLSLPFLHPFKLWSGSMYSFPVVRESYPYLAGILWEMLHL